MRKTKIVCTIGPASESREKIIALCKAGMNVARLNFSHGTHEEHLARIETIKSVREELNMPIAILLDTKGPEYRIGTFANHKIHLEDGADFTFTTDTVEGSESIVSVSYKKLHEELHPGDTVLVNNGILVFEVVSVEGHEIHTKVIAGGDMSDRKSMSFPGKILKQVYLSEQDKKDIAFGVANDIDFIACSFVSCRQDLTDVHNYLNEIGASPSIELIAKIENQAGIDNIEDICEECTGIMVARGDLGVEIPFEKLPAVQKMLISKCRLLGKRVITATEMLESMINNPRPTRAEISDVANAVYDGTSAIMLSGETAAGKYPVEAVATMAKIAVNTEKNIDYVKVYHSADFRIRNTVDAISHATVGMAIDIGAKAIAVNSISGMTARMVSRFRGPVDVVGITTDIRTWRKLALSWAITPVLAEYYNSTDVLFYMAKNLTTKAMQLQPGDKIIITGGSNSSATVSTNLIKIEEA